jgi:uncharacterized tellurite resistance protein B-like protein
MTLEDNSNLVVAIDRVLDTLPNGEPTPFQAKVAVMVTLLEAVHSAGEKVEGEELGVLSNSMLHEFGLTDGEVGHLIEVANLLRKDPDKAHTLMEKVSVLFSLDQKLAILSVVWRILMSDNRVDPEEGAVAVRIRKALGLSMEAAVSARQQAQAHTTQELVQGLVSSCGEPTS